MGVGMSGRGGGGGKFGFREGGSDKNRKIRDGGGNPKTESAVDWALKWLAAHQEYDGRWDCKKYGGGNNDVAVTSLALLAFLGAGQTERNGKFKENVARGSAWLAKQVDEKGNVGPYRYETPIGVMALSEIYGMGENKYKAVAQKAVTNLLNSQCDTGAWDYSPNSKRSDTSVTGWAVMAIKSAKIAYLEVSEDKILKAKTYLQKATIAEGGNTSYSSEGGDIKCGGGSKKMNAVALTGLQFLGVPRNDMQVQGAAIETVKTLPTTDLDFYLTYYQALGLFQTGVRGEYWKKFNEPMKNSLLTTQIKIGTFEENKGSWNPEGDPHGKSWGRVGETALGALILEVYYRFAEVKQQK
jgi:hypothetical protein